VNEAIEKGYRLRFAEYSQFEFRNTSGSAKDLEGVQLEQVNLLREAGKSGDLSLIVSVEKTTLKELAVVERHIGIVDDPVRYKAIDEAHSLPRNRKGDLPYDEARQALRSQYARLNNMDKARLGDAEKLVIDARRSNILQAEKLYKERQVKALGQGEQGVVYQRAQAFDGRNAEEALARYPELDGAYKQLAGREGADRVALQAKLSEQLHRGELPQADVTKEESRQVMAMAAAQRELIVRDGDSFDRGIKGEVVAGSSHHVLVRVSDQVGLVYGRDRLDREVQVGERVSIEPGQQQHRVMAQEQVTAREPGRDQGRER
jgi:hypothetical protein